MAEAVIVPAGLEHAVELAMRLRPGELAELRAQGYERPVEALERGLRESEAYAVLYRGEVVAMFGLGPDRGAAATALGAHWLGVVWFLTGQDFPRAAWRGLRLARRVVAWMLEQYPTVAVLIDARYDAALRWARRLGFSTGAPVPYGPLALPFIPAVARRSAE